MMTALTIIALLFALTVVVSIAGYFFNQGGFFGFIMWYELMGTAGDIFGALLQAIGEALSNG